MKRVVFVNCFVEDNRLDVVPDSLTSATATAFGSPIANMTVLVRPESVKLRDLLDDLVARDENNKPATYNSAPDLRETALVVGESSACLAELTDRIRRRMVKAGLVIVDKQGSGVKPVSLFGSHKLDEDGLVGWITSRPEPVVDEPDALDMFINGDDDDDDEPPTPETVLNGEYAPEIVDDAVTDATGAPEPHAEVAAVPEAQINRSYVETPDVHEPVIVQSEQDDYQDDATVTEPEVATEPEPVTYDPPSPPSDSLIPPDDIEQERHPATHVERGDSLSPKDSTSDDQALGTSEAVVPSAAEPDEIEAPVRRRRYRPPHRRAGHCRVCLVESYQGGIGKTTISYAIAYSNAEANGYLHNIDHQRYAEKVTWIIEGDNTSPKFFDRIGQGEGRHLGSILRYIEDKVQRKTLSNSTADVERYMDSLRDETLYDLAIQNSYKVPATNLYILPCPGQDEKIDYKSDQLDSLVARLVGVLRERPETEMIVVDGRQADTRRSMDLSAQLSNLADYFIITTFGEEKNFNAVRNLCDDLITSDQNSIDASRIGIYMTNVSREVKESYEEKLSDSPLRICGFIPPLDEISSKVIDPAQSRTWLPNASELTMSYAMYSVFNFFIGTWNREELRPVVKQLKYKIAKDRKEQEEERPAARRPRPEERRDRPERGRTRQDARPRRRPRPSADGEDERRREREPRARRSREDQERRRKSGEQERRKSGSTRARSKKEESQPKKGKFGWLRH